VPFPNALLLRAQSDDRLVALARAGHERAFDVIVERHRRSLVRVCRQVLPEAQAEDAAQHALVAAWTALSRGDEVRDLRPWLHRVARNAALNQLRALRPSEELPDRLEGGPRPEDEFERRAAARRVLTDVAGLPERQRRALLAIAVHGRGQDAVAAELGLTEGAVRQLVLRARARLRQTASALTPMPLAAWAAAGSGSGEAAVTLAKVGAVAVLAGGAAAAGPALVQRAGRDLPPPPAAAIAKPAPDRTAAAPTAPARTVAPASTRVAPSAVPLRAAAPVATPAPARRRTPVVLVDTRAPEPRTAAPAPRRGGDDEREDDDEIESEPSERAETPEPDEVELDGSEPGEHELSGRSGRSGSGPGEPVEPEEPEPDR
jgi:RNA polymerase sigma factor (sigma-70 family)